MKDQGLIAGQTKAVNRVFVLVVGLAAFMWSGTLIDKILGMGWAWDRQILWLAPSMVVFAALVRFCTLAIQFRRAELLAFAFQPLQTWAPRVQKVVMDEDEKRWETRLKEAAKAAPEKPE